MSSTLTLLNILYTQSSGSSTSSANPITALQQAEANQTKDVAATAAQPATARDIANFTAAVNNATSVTDLLKNPDFLKVFLTANNLASQIPYTALAQKALLSNPNDTASLANTLSDTSWKSTVSTYDFYDKGLSVVQSPQVMSTLTNAYAEVTWRNSLDAATPGLSDALTFRANASTYTTADQILGDPVARNVVTTALNIPQQIAFQPLEAQQRAITNNLNIADLQNPSYVETFTQRFLIASAQNASSSSTPDLTALAVQAAGLMA